MNSWAVGINSLAIAVLAISQFYQTTMTQRMSARLARLEFRVGVHHGRAEGEAARERWDNEHLDGH